MKTNILKAICTLFVLQYSLVVSVAQISTHEVPYGLSTKSITTTRNVVVLEVPDMQQVYNEDKENDINGGFPRISVPIFVDFNIEHDGEWIKLPDGGSLWRLTLSAVGAKSLDFVFDYFWLPEGAKFFVYNPETKESIGAITSQFLEGNRQQPADFSTGIILGDKMTLEYYQPKYVKENPIININVVYYGYRYVQDYRNRGFGNSGVCQVNINCSEGEGWQKEKEAVARIYVKTPSGGGWCSGSLVNNTKQDFKPLFLTANHCSGNYFDAYGNTDMSKWIFYWHYEQPNCNNTNIEPPIYSTKGAVLKANNSISDFALLELQQDPRELNPNSATFPVYFEKKVIIMFVL